MFTLWAIVGAIGMAGVVIGTIKEDLALWMFGMQMIAAAAYFMAMHAKQDKEEISDEPD